MRRFHLAILKRPYVEAIVDGRKQVESRFSIRRRGYFGLINRGDKVFLKVSSGPVCASATIGEVKRFFELGPIKIREL